MLAKNLIFNIFISCFISLGMGSQSSDDCRVSVGRYLGVFITAYWLTLMSSLCGVLGLILNIIITGLLVISQLLPCQLTYI